MTTTLPDYDDLDALAVADLVRRGEVTPAELLAAAQERIAQRNPMLDAVIHELGDLANLAIAHGLPDGPFSGVPFLAKDLFAYCAGAPCGNGSRLFDGYVPDDDAGIVARCRAAGLVIAGRTKTSEFGLSVTTEPLAFGPTKNPWDLSRTAGGSSGGSAAAVAARMVPMAHGSDGGGSIRIPAACCGVFGLKPTRGRITLGPGVGEAWAGLATHHAVTRSVRDSAALLDATAGPLTGDPYIIAAPERPFLDHVGADPGRLRIGVSVVRPDGNPVASECRRVVEEAATMVADFGHIVEIADPAIDLGALKTVMETIVAANMAADLPRLHPTTGKATTADDVEPLTWAFVERGRTLSAADYIAAVHRMQSLGRAFATYFDSHDVWLSPALATAPPTLGRFSTDTTDIGAFGDAVLAFTPFTSIANVSGQPAAAVPFDRSEEGVPIAIQITGRYGAEATLLALAAQFEAARPWAGCIPGL